MEIIEVTIGVVLIGFIFYQIYVFRQSNKALKANYGRDVSSCLSSEMFHAICQKNKCGVYQAVQGGMIDELSQYGLSPLMVAIEEDESLAKLLIDQGADLTFCAEMFPKLMPYPRHFQMNKDLYMKHTAMGVAMGMESEALVKRLLLAGHIVELKSDLIHCMSYEFKQRYLEWVREFSSECLPPLRDRSALLQLITWPSMVRHFELLGEDQMEILRHCYFPTLKHYVNEFICRNDVLGVICARNMVDRFGRNILEERSFLHIRHLQMECPSQVLGVKLEEMVDNGFDLH